MVVISYRQNAAPPVPSPASPIPAAGFATPVGARTLSKMGTPAGPKVASFKSKKEKRKGLKNPGASRKKGVKNGEEDQDQGDRSVS